MSLKNSVKAIPLTSILGTAVTSSYKPINATGLPESCFQIHIFNNSDTDVTVSYDGTTDNEFLPHGLTVPREFQSNLQTTNTAGLISRGTVVYVKGSAGSTGSIYLSGYYMPNGI